MAVADMQIDPKILEAIMSGQNVPGYFSNRTQGYWRDGTGDGGNMTDYFQPDGADTWTISQPMGNNMVAEWLGDGSFRGINQDTSADHRNGQALVQAAILAAAGGALSGVGSGAAGSTLPATATSAYGGAGSMTLPTMAEMGVGAATVTPELLATMPALGGTAAAGGALGASFANQGTAGQLMGLDVAPASVQGAAGTMPAMQSAGGAMAAEGAFNPNGITDPNFGANASFGGTTSVGGLGGSIPAGGGGLMDGGNWLSTLGQLAGAAAGAYGSRDQQQTQSRDPWGPAQPALKGLLDQLQTLQQQYQQNPLSNLQKQAYGNQFGLLNAANQGASGMLAGMQANAGGQNSYSRQNKGRSLVGSNPTWSWTPGLLNMGG
jgi:hypothetical protein